MGTHPVRRYEFTDHERGVLAGIVRDNLRRTSRRALTGAQKFGVDWDPTPAAERVALLRRIYTELGGDPDQITNLRPLPQHPNQPED